MYIVQNSVKIEYGTQRIKQCVNNYKDSVFKYVRQSFEITPTVPLTVNC